MAKPTLISDIKPAALHRGLGINRTYAWELVKGVKTPSLELAVRIERQFGVPVAAWIERAA